MSSSEGTGGRRGFMLRMRSKYRLSIFNASTYQEVWGVHISKLNSLVALGVLFILIFGVAILVVFFTPIRRLVPGYNGAVVSKQVVANALRADSLTREFALWDGYLSNIRTILSGGVPPSFTSEFDTLGASSTPALSPAEGTSLSDSLFPDGSGSSPLSLLVASEQRIGTEPRRLELLPPVRGSVISSYGASQGHFGTDIVAQPEAVITSVAPGRVIMASWDVDTGHTLVIQHEGELISIYKHNARLLKNTGDRVQAGDAIAIMGSTGKLSTGPHLHFELWRGGQALNAEHYISF